MFLPFSTKLKAVGPWLMAAVLCVSNAALLAQNLRMRGELAKFKPNVLELGQKVPALSAVTLGGNRITIDYSGGQQKYVLFYFSPECPYCVEQFVYWRQILAGVDQSRYVLLGLAPESNNWARHKEYLKSVGCESLPIAFVDAEMRRSYKLTLTPITLVIGNLGAVEHAWAGKWDSRVSAEVSSVLGLKLAGSIGVRKTSRQGDQYETIIETRNSFPVCQPHHRNWCSLCTTVSSEGGRLLFGGMSGGKPDMLWF